MRQSTAKELAERVTKKRCKMKEINHRKCIFVNEATSTKFFGSTWDEAFDRLLKLSHIPETVRQALKSNDSPPLSSDKVSADGSAPSSAAVETPEVPQTVTPTESSVAVIE